MNKTRKNWIIIISILIFLTLCFIYINSMLPKKESANESERVYSWLNSIFDFIFGSGVITHSIFRKMAHAGEFFVLSLETNTLFCLLNCYSIKKLLFILPIGFLAGAVDEFIQIFSLRGATFLDVLIDFSGFFVSTIIFYLIYLIIKKIKIHKKIKKNNN